MTNKLTVAVLAMLIALTGVLATIAGARQPDLPGGMASIRMADLPAEARETLRMIEHGGPLPYRRDGATFGNRERLLPPHPRGYYREHTVRTPGEHDRGERRIVTGRGGERYYTADHYRSFRRIVP